MLQTSRWRCVDAGETLTFGSPPLEPRQRCKDADGQKALVLRRGCDITIRTVFPRVPGSPLSPLMPGGPATPGAPAGPGAPGGPIICNTRTHRHKNSKDELDIGA